MQTREKPYGIILNYDWLESEQNYKKTAIYNSTYLFALVQNVDWITFIFGNQQYKITKEDLQNWYGEDFSGLQSEDELKTFIQKQLDDADKVNLLFS
nr:DUF4825 domain-containing protein [Solibacillus sp. R5-41]